MEKTYLVITKYEHVSDGINEVSEKEIGHSLGKKDVHVFEYDFDKIKSILTEVELKVVPKQNEKI